MPDLFRVRMKNKMNRAGMTKVVRVSQTHASNRLSILASSSDVGAVLKNVITLSFKVQERLHQIAENNRKLDVSKVNAAIDLPMYRNLIVAVKALSAANTDRKVKVKINTVKRAFDDNCTWDDFDEGLAQIQDMLGSKTEAGMNIESRIKAHMASAAYEPAAKHKEVIANYCKTLIEYGHRWQADAQRHGKGAVAGTEAHFTNNFYSTGIGHLMKGLAGVGKGLPPEQEALIDKMYSQYHSGGYNWINTAKELLAMVGGPKKTQAAVETTAAPLAKSTYEWYQYNSDKPTTITTVSGKQKVRLTKGSRFGVRMSTTKDIVRIITDELGPTIVFSYAQPTVPNALKKNSLKLLGGKNTTPAKATKIAKPAAKAEPKIVSGDRKIEAVQRRVAKMLDKVNDKMISLTNSSRDLRKQSTYMRARKNSQDLARIAEAIDSELSAIRSMFGFS